MSPYGLSKVAAERYVELWREQSGGECVVLRLTNVYGPRQNAQGEAGVVSIFTERALDRRPCIVNADGEQTRDFVFVGDVVDAAVRAVDRPAVAGVFNVSTGRETSINELTCELLRVLPASPTVSHGPVRSGEQRRSVLDPRRAAEYLGWQASTALAEGLRMTVTAAVDRRSAQGDD